MSILLYSLERSCIGKLPREADAERNRLRTPSERKIGMSTYLEGDSIAASIPIKCFQYTHQGVRVRASKFWIALSGKNELRRLYVLFYSVLAIF